MENYAAKCKNQNFMSKLRLKSLFYLIYVKSFIKTRTEFSRYGKSNPQIRDNFLCSLIRFIHDHKKTFVAVKIFGNLLFFVFFLGSPLNFDKEKWY